MQTFGWVIVSVLAGVVANMISRKVKGFLRSCREADEDLDQALEDLEDT